MRMRQGLLAACHTALRGAVSVAGKPFKETLTAYRFQGEVDLLEQCGGVRSCTHRCGSALPGCLASTPADTTAIKWLSCRSRLGASSAGDGHIHDLVEEVVEMRAGNELEPEGRGLLFRWDQVLALPSSVRARAPGK